MYYEENEKTTIDASNLEKQKVAYRFSITDEYNWTKEQIKKEALSIAQGEFDSCGLNIKPKVQITFETIKDGHKYYEFIATGILR